MSKIKWTNDYKDIITDLYCNKKLTQSKIAKLLNTKQNTISSLMQRFKIKVKDNKLYLCEICGKQLSAHRKSKSCHSCENKRRYTIGILNNSGINNGRYKGGKPKCIDCGKKLAQYKGLRCKSCRNKHHIMKGRNNPAFGKAPYWKLIKYNKNNFRSSWEANFAKWCDGSGIEWKYESKTFDLGTTTYTPDFYLPEFDCYIEIKGWWQGNSKKKFNFVKKYFNENFIVLKYKQLKTMSII